MSQLIKRLYEAWMRDYDGYSDWEVDPEKNGYTHLSMGCGLRYHVFGSDEGECIAPKPSPGTYRGHVKYDQYEISVFIAGGHHQMTIYQRLSNDAKHYHPLYSDTYMTHIDISRKTDDDIYDFFIKFVNQANEVAKWIDQINDPELTCVQEK